MVRHAWIGVAIAAAVALAGCDGDGGEAEPRTPEVVATQAPRIEVTGLDNERRPDALATRHTLPAAPEIFGLWDFESAVIYDIANRRTINLGRGSLGSFSPDGATYAWIADPGEDGAGELRVIELATKQQRALGRARSAVFVDDALILIEDEVEAGSKLIDAFTGESVDGVEPPGVDPAFIETETPAGYLLRRPLTNPRAPYELINPATGNVLLRVDVMYATPAGEDAILVMTRAFDADASNNVDGSEAEETTNLFLIDIESGNATFVASAVGHLGSPPFSMPAAASQDYVAWTPYYCGITQQGHTRIYDRATREVRELDASLHVGFTPNGMLTDDIGHGVQRIIDPRTLEHITVIPLGSDIAWSPDYRYAAQGLTFGGHGGPCP